MKKTYRVCFIFTLLLLASAAVLPFLSSDTARFALAPFSIAGVISAAVCFLGILGLMAWEKWLESQAEKVLQEKTDQLKDEIKAQNLKIINLKSELEKAKSERNLPETILRRLLDVAEKLRIKTIEEDIQGNQITRKTREEVPPDIRNLIDEQFKVIFQTDNSTKP